ncbi:MAG TPA: phage holin family protein [Armatimonadota bacterium]|nr:phage holin family protein [Armatimonadota bacterium]
MKRLFWHWIISSIALVLTAMALHNGVSIDPLYNALWIAPLLGFINFSVGALAHVVSWIAYPVNLLTLGCFGFILSFIGYIFAITYLSHKLGTLFQVHGFLWAAAFAVVMALFSTLLNIVLPGKSSRRG